MAKPLLAKCKRFFPDLPLHVSRNLRLVCWAAILARFTKLNVLKDYLPQLLNSDQTKAHSPYKRLVQFFQVSTPNRLVSLFYSLFFGFFTATLPI